MKSLEEMNRSYIGRRKKEYLPLMVVRFLRAYDPFNGMYRAFARCPQGSGDFGKTGHFPENA